MDNAKTSWWQCHRPSTRRLVQVYSALLYNAHLKGFIEGEIYQGNTKAVCVPGFNCYSCPGAVGACPLGAIQNALTSLGHRAGWYVLGIILLYGVILGRTICGWICPLGLVQELLHKIPTPKLRKSRVTRALSWLKYVILGVFVVAIPLWYGLAHDMTLPAFCKYICPAGTFEGALGLMPVRTSIYSMLSILFTRKFVILMVIGLACIFCYRSFCRFICPLGAIYSLFNRFNIVGVRVDASRCNHCGACVRHCGMDVRRVGDHECISCGKCMDVCRQGAISLKAGRLTLKGPEIGCAGDPPEAAKKRRNVGRVVWGIALVVLVFALLWYNVLDPAIRDPESAAPAPVAIAADTPAEVTVSEAPLNITDAAPAGKSSSDASTESVTETSSDQPESTESTEASISSWQSTAPIGFSVGQQLADFSAACYDGSTFHLADTRGKVVFINLWATWCGPCVQELPHFNALCQKHAGDIAMIAISTQHITDDPVAYVSAHFGDYSFPFATDPDGSLFKILNGSTTLPQTIVLNRKGEVVYNEQHSVTPEALDALWEKASLE